MYAQVAKLVDAPSSGGGAVRCAGSNPVLGTNSLTRSVGAFYLEAAQACLQMRTNKKTSPAKAGKGIWVNPHLWITESNPVLGTNSLTRSVGAFFWKRRKLCLQMRTNKKTSPAKAGKGIWVNPHLWITESNPVLGKSNQQWLLFLLD